MVKWQQRQAPPICERMIGFSVPTADEILVISYDNYSLLKLGNPITVRRDERFVEYDLYDPKTGVASYEGISYTIIGLHGGNPILESSAGERLVLDTQSETLSILKNGHMDFSMKYKNFSGDWAVATFSTNGRFVILGCPYDFDFVVIERVETG
jgi:hypothetical protein